MTETQSKSEPSTVKSNQLREEDGEGKLVEGRLNLHSWRGDEKEGVSYRQMNMSESVTIGLNCGDSLG